MPPTASDKVHAQNQKRKEKAQRKKHATAQEKYRQKNLDKLREEARLRMRIRRAAIQQDEGSRKQASEQRREIDADYRERKGLEFDTSALSSPSSQRQNSFSAIIPKKIKIVAHRGGVAGRAMRQKAPPAGFRPCDIPMHLGENFTDHVEFSAKGNKRYWVLYLGRGQGVYTLKAECIAAAGTYAKQPKAYEALDRWQLVLPHWAKHCFHRHAKCRLHQDVCIHGECPIHPSAPNPDVVRVPRSVKVKPEIKPKVEPDIKPKVECDVRPKVERGPLTKKNLAARAQRAIEKAARRPPPRYTPVEESDIDSDGGRRVPLFDPNSSEEERSPPPARPSAPPHATPPSPTPAPIRREDVTLSLKRNDQNTSTPPPSSVGMSSVSSLSTSPPRSTADAGEQSASLITRTGDVSAQRDDPFYVGSGGVIHHSSSKAFEDVSSGPVRVVIGWEEATRVAREVASGKRRLDKKGKGKATELANVASSRSMDVD
ncbi:hypothetical protein B0H13DRAFT_1914461 [Mycena leptocephala]|nr:hypothetical protein B0H13DRAFT_1914461 [Mycena leptocephala]